MAEGFRRHTTYRMDQRFFDPFVHALTVISEPHRMIHDGFMFDSTGIFAAVANGATVDTLFTFPAGVIGHLTNVEYQLDDAPCLAEFYENVVTSADGTAALVVNKNRIIAPAAPGAVITDAPTITDIGDLLYSRHIPSASSPGQQAAGALVPGDEHEWVIGATTVEKKFLWRITNNSGGPITIGYHFNGYEIGYEHNERITV